MLKSSTLDDDKPKEREVVSTLFTRLEADSRIALGISGGRSACSAAASIDVLFINARLAAPIALPFKVYANNVEVLFDEIEPSPVAEGFGDCDKCEETIESFSPEHLERDKEIVIEASVKIAFSVKVTQEEQTKFELGCETCFGYTMKQVRCKNKRKSLQGQRVWCYHHKSQEQEFQRFQTYGDRPEFCVWWQEK
jgi:hypothetical protein